ncbi:MAG TPA: hypothetical protein VF518_09185 [Polyangia bacterium]
MRLTVAVATALLLGLVAWDFAAATTFVGDDYLFLAFARLEPNPFLAFVRDLHGGEYYRPLPMLLWAGLDRLGQGGRWPFGLAGFLLHVGNAALVGVLGRGVGFPARVAWLAGALFLVAPAEREAALWFSASTDLLATLTTLASIVCLLRGSRLGRVASIGCAALAYFSKETALVLPLLAVAALSTRRISWRGRIAPVLPHGLLAAGYLGARFAVLHGLGGTNDPLAPWWGRGLQILGGVFHAVTGYAPIPEAMAWLVGGALLLAAGWFALRTRAWFPILWTLLALLPLPAAGWVVGARYFYLPAVGLIFMLALAIDARGTAARVTAISLLAVLGLACSVTRMGEVRRYRAVLAAAREAVVAGGRAGHHVFLVRNAVKDLDLALKLTSPADRLPQPLLVIPDVPASFVAMPDGLADRADFLLARPPLPPAGAYRFGNQRVMGLARREEAPDLDDVLARLPELRIVELLPARGPVTWRDVR